MLWHWPYTVLNSLFALFAWYTHFSKSSSTVGCRLKCADGMLKIKLHNSDMMIININWRRMMWEDWPTWLTIVKHRDMVENLTCWQFPFEVKNGSENSKLPAHSFKPSTRRTCCHVWSGQSLMNCSCTGDTADIIMVKDGRGNENQQSVCKWRQVNSLSWTPRGFVELQSALQSRWRKLSVLFRFLFLRKLLT